MKPKEIRALNKEATDKKLTELRKEMVKLRAQIAIGTAMKNPGQVKKVRKTIARILTIQSESSGKKPEVGKKA